MLVARITESDPKGTFADAQATGYAAGMSALYDKIGIGYDGTRKADPWVLGKLSHYLKIKGSERYIDVACGTGNYTIALASLGARITGIDVSQEMLNAAQAKAPHNDLLDWQKATVERLPFDTDFFAGAVCTLAIHHFSDLVIAFREVSRVLDPLNGRFVIFTSTPEQTSRYWLGRYFPTMIQRSVKKMPSLESVVAALRDAELPEIKTEPYSVRPDHEDMFLYSGKHRPHLYLDAHFRSGISSFASLADNAEIKVGLSCLADDIKSGHIADVINASHHDEGDYIVVCAERSPRCAISTV